MHSPTPTPTPTPSGRKKNIEQAMNSLTSGKKLKDNQVRVPSTGRAA